MDANRFDELVRSCRWSRTRRSTVGAVGTIALTRLIACMAPVAEAKKKKKKRKKKKKAAPAPPPPPPPSPPVSPPPPTGPGSCPYDGVSTGFQASNRYAQTFLPSKSGQLTGATFSLRSSPVGFDATVQIRNVDSLGVPANTILASEHINDISQTVFPAINPVSVAFDPPATLVIGQTYALTITGSTAGFAIHTNNAGNTCPDGAFFFDTQGDGTFILATSGNADLVYALTIAG